VVTLSDRASDCGTGFGEWRANPARSGRIRR
jgi:hypothetical protein